MPKVARDFPWRTANVRVSVAAILQSPNIETGTLLRKANGDRTGKIGTDAGKKQQIREVYWQGGKHWADGGR